VLVAVHVERHDNGSFVAAIVPSTQVHIEVRAPPFALHTIPLHLAREIKRENANFMNFKISQNSLFLRILTMLMNLKNKIRYHDLTEICDAGVQLVIEENIRPIVMSAESTLAC